MSDNIANISDIFSIPTTAKEQFLPADLKLAGSLRASGVNLAGISQVYPPYEIGRRDPNFHLVLYTVSGSAHITTGWFERTLKANDLFICPAHCSHYYRPDAKWQIAWFHLSDIPRWSLLRGLLPKVSYASLLPRLLWAMEGLIEEGFLSKPSGNTATLSYADLILFYLERELEAGEEGSSTSRVQFRRLWAHVNAYLQYPWSINDLAERMVCSSAQLYRLTATEYGTTPMGMVARLRMERVKDLLRSTDYCLEYIASTVGYATPFALSKAFRNHTGQSPRDFRRNHRPRS